jgi:hypothetical protein
MAETTMLASEIWFGVTLVFSSIAVARCASPLEREASGRREEFS